MKKPVLLTLVAILMLCPLIVKAESEKKETYDPSWFEKLDGYSYDKFEKHWMYQYEVLFPCSDPDYDTVLHFDIDGDNNSILYGGPRFYGYLQNGEDIVSFDFLIDDKLFSYPEVASFRNANGIRVGEKDKDFFEALMNASELLIRIKTDSTTLTLTVNDDSLDGIKLFASKMIEHNVWSFATDESGQVEYCEENCPLVRN